MDEDVQRPEREQLRLSVPRRLAILVLALLAGSSLHAEPAAVAPGHVPEPAGLYKGAMHGYTPNTVTGGSVIDTEALATLVAAQHPLMLDVAEADRKPPSMGKTMLWLPTHRSIPGAVFLQGGGKGSKDAAYVEAFRTRVAALTSGDKGKPIVTFCHPDCWGSYNAAKRLVAMGYSHVYWYRDGVEGWQAEHDTAVVKPDAAFVAALAKDATQ